MDIAHQQLKRVDILTLTGRLDAAAADDLAARLDHLLQTQRDRIVLDLAQLEHVSSPGLWVLANARKRAHDGQFRGLRGGDIRLANLSPRLTDLFDLVGFTALFQIYPTTTAAVESF